MLNRFKGFLLYRTLALFVLCVVFFLAGCPQHYCAKMAECGIGDGSESECLEAVDRDLRRAKFEGCSGEYNMLLACLSLASCDQLQSDYSGICSTERAVLDECPSE